VKNTPLFSFCVPTYRRAGFVAQTISSALAQTIDNIEVVVVDDCSPDDTAEVVKRFRDERIRYVRNVKNLGVPENLNRALSLGRGTYLVLLEDHDLLDPKYAEETLRIMEKYPSVGFVATGIITIDETGNPRERHVENLPEFVAGRKLLRKLLTRTSCPFSVTTVIRRCTIREISPLFDSRCWWYADQHLWLRLSALSDFGYVARPLLKFRMRESDHYLINRHWESFLCLDRIHKDDWHLLHPRSGLKSWVDWLSYEKAKLKSVAMVRAGRRLRYERWTEEDDRFSQVCLSRISTLALKLVDLIPLWLVLGLRTLYRIYRKEVTRIDRKSSTFS
jgi:glycosyltransferase involved in cell wall biosynthesis